MDKPRNRYMTAGGCTFPPRKERRVLPLADYVCCLEQTLRDVRAGSSSSIRTDCAFSFGAAVARRQRSHLSSQSFFFGCFSVCRPPLPPPCYFVEWLAFWLAFSLFSRYFLSYGIFSISPHISSVSFCSRRCVCVPPIAHASVHVCLAVCVCVHAKVETKLEMKMRIRMTTRAATKMRMKMKIRLKLKVKPKLKPTIQMKMFRFFPFLPGSVLLPFVFFCLRLFFCRMYLDREMQICRDLDVVLGADEDV